MGLIDLPIGKPSYNVDPQAKVLAVDEARDCYYEKAPEGKYIIRRRPGYSLFSSPGATRVDVDGVERTGQGIFWSDRLAAAFVVSGGNLYKINSIGEATQLVGATIETGKYAVFAEGQDLALKPFIYIAHSGTLRYTDGSTLSTPADVNVPTKATFVASLNNRIFADNGGQDFLITDTDPGTGLIDPFYWSMVDNPWRSALRADTATALIAAWNEVAVWGTQTIEYWQEDGVNPISPLVGATSEIGTDSPKTIVIADNAMFALATVTGKRAIVRIQNRTPQIISGDIDRELQKYNMVTDAIGVLCFPGGLNHYIINFPTARKTWAYDLKEGLFTEWGTWNSQISQYDSFPLAGSCYAKSWNKHLFLGQDGKVYVLSREVYQDAGKDIRTLIRTGWINHGTGRRKRSRQLYVKFKSYNPTPASILLRWRDDGRPEWSNYVELPIGAESEQTQFAQLTRNGIYRSRQYEFLLTDNADLALSGMSEEVEELRN